MPAPCQAFQAVL
uniref:Uncharacterized protein n=1 Tax=Macrostomum lignano TaxID=282301 RepID=A0A1I8GLQ5_9PLAT